MYSYPHNVLKGIIQDKNYLSFWSTDIHGTPVTENFSNRLKKAIQIYRFDPPNYHQLAYARFSYNQNINYAALRSFWIDFIASSPDDVPIDLYVHIPFCKQKCSFCQCVVFISNQENVFDQYLQFLKDYFLYFREIFQKKKIRNVYFGGGTTNSLGLERITDLLTTIFSIIELDDRPFERTFELHPAFTTNELLKLLKKFGFNRISFGLESFNQKTVEAINRIYVSPRQMQSIVDQAKQNGFLEINANLIIGLDQEDEAMFLNSLRILCEIQPSSIIIYVLMKNIEKSSWYSSKEVFYKRVKKLNKTMHTLLTQHGYLGEINEKDYAVGFGYKRVPYEQRKIKTVYEAFNLDNSALFSVGYKALGGIPGKFRFLNCAEIKKFDPEKNDSIAIAPLDLKQQIGLYIIRQLQNGFLDLNQVNKEFHCDSWKLFEKEFGFCIRNNIIIQENLTLSWREDNMKKNYISGMLFIDEAELNLIIQNYQNGEMILNRTWHEPNKFDNLMQGNELSRVCNQSISWLGFQKRPGVLKLRFKDHEKSADFYMEISSSQEKYYCKTQGGKFLSYRNIQLAPALEKLIQEVAAIF